MGRKAPTTTGQRVNDLIIKKHYNAEDATRAILGEFNPFIPPGSQIVSRGINGIVYIDPDGYLHTQEREGDANSADFGRLLQDQTNRPAVLPISQSMPGSQGVLSQATAAIQKGLSGELGTLTPSDKALLDQMTKSTMEQLKQQFTTQGGQLVAQLYGRGMNESSLANDAVGRLEQQQGLVTNQALSDAAARELSIRQFLTQLTTGAGVDIFNSMIGNETQRAIASGNIGLGEKQLDQNRTDSARNFQLENEKLNIARSQASPWRSILSAVASLGASALAGPIGGSIAGKIGGGVIAQGSLPRITY
jgi:hypothetical protein